MTVTSDTPTGVLSLRANVQDYPQTKALKDGTVSSEIVTLDFCGPPLAQNGFKPMLRENAFDCGELAIVKTARALAAWEKATEIGADHVRRAAALALPHRMRRRRTVSPSPSRLHPPLSSS